MWKTRFAALSVLLVGALLGYFAYTTETPENRFAFQFGLDLAGGTHLVYRADTSALQESEIPESMQALRGVIERRVNDFGVSEPNVQVEESGIFSGVSEQRLIVELPGVTDTEEAIRRIGETPVLDFRLLKEDVELPEETTADIDYDQYFKRTELTGRFLQDASLQFGSGGGVTNDPYILLEFNSEGALLFAKITRANVGRVLGIFLDGRPIQLPVIQEEIPSGRASITGQYSPEEARDIVRDLDLGALPVPIELISTQTIGSAFGAQAVLSGMYAGVIGLALVALFMLLWYRIPGLIAVLALALYIAAMFAVFKVIPVTLTAAGIAGFILSLGMAVDANVLIFERIKEELRAGATIRNAVREGFRRAWPSIRDANLSSIIIAIILFYMSTSLVQGFALVFGIGVIVSMTTAITASRSMLLVLPDAKYEGIAKFFFGSGISSR